MPTSEPSGWTMTLDVVADSSTNEEAIDEMVDYLAPYGASASVDHDLQRWSVTLSLDPDQTELGLGANVLDAISVGYRVVHECWDKLDLPNRRIVRIEALTFEEHDRELAEPTLPEFVGVSEIAGMLGVSRQRASDLRNRAGFPKPHQVLAAGPIWPVAWVRNFVDSWHRRPGRPPNTS